MPSTRLAGDFGSRVTGAFHTKTVDYPFCALFRLLLIAFLVHAYGHPLEASRPEQEDHPFPTKLKILSENLLLWGVRRTKKMTRTKQ